mmetsp:Transcript_17084/g.38426  ORF Transcript_17084/g.38426 Transcript_17084/m.38426 type:complete len:88 (-) Transcript_17084:108-371(-)
MAAPAAGRKDGESAMNERKETIASMLNSTISLFVESASEPFSLLLCRLWRVGCGELLYRSTCNDEIELRNALVPIIAQFVIGVSLAA